MHQTRTPFNLFSVAALVLLSSCATVPPILAGSAVASQKQSADRAEIEALNGAFTDAWNTHDMVAFSKLFHPDADWVNWRGGLWTGRPAIYEGHRAIHVSYYRNTVSTLVGIEALEFVSPTIAYVRVRTNMTGDERTPGVTHRYRRMMLVTKRDVRWLISKGHNTRIADGVE